MTKKFSANGPSLDRLRPLLTKPYAPPDEQQAALRLAWQWIREGHFGFADFEKLMGMAETRGREEAELDHADG